MICENSERSEWKIVKLLDVLEFIVDNRGKTVPTATSGIPLIATNCIKNDSLFPVFEKIRYVSEEIYSSWFRSHPKPGDIIFVNKGTPGRVCLVPNPVDFCIAQDMVALRADDKQIYPKYLFAVLRSPFIQQQIENMHVGTMIPHFKKGDFKKLSIPIPRREIQQFIGDCYFSLSMKIELNNRINKTLEEIAQAIFKQWFVDFDFPDENGQPYKSSGGEMEESELGMIPKGWKVGCFGDITNNYDSKRVPLSKREREKRLKVYPYYGAASLMDYVDDYLFDGVYVLMGEDGTVVDAKGYPQLQYVWGKFWVNNHAHVLQGSDQCGTEYIYLLLKNTNVASIVTGAVQPKITQGNLNTIKIIIPSRDILMRFSKDITPLFSLYRNKCEQNINLSVIRDSLLPKLMSGEIRVPIEEVPQSV